MATSAFARVPKTQKWAVAVQPSAVRCSASTCTCTRACTEYKALVVPVGRCSNGENARAGRWRVGPQQRHQAVSRGPQTENRTSESRQRDANAKTQQRGIGLGILPSRMGTGSSGAGKGSGGQAGAWEWDGRGIQHQDWRFSFVLLFFCGLFWRSRKRRNGDREGPLLSTYLGKCRG